MKTKLISHEKSIFLQREIEFLMLQKSSLPLHEKSTSQKPSQRIYKREQNRLLNALGFHAVASQPSSIRRLQTWSSEIAIFRKYLSFKRDQPRLYS